MVAPTIPCPTIGQLQQFAIGNLADEVLERLADHLETCSVCEDTLSTIDLSSDLFVRALAGSSEPEDCATAAVLQQALVSVREWATQGHQVMLLRDTKSLRQDLTPARHLTVPYTLGQYELLEELGRGGMGIVYKANHTRLQRVVAVKVLAPHRFNDVRAAARFNQEMRMVGQLSHPNVVAATDAAEMDGIHFLVMEYLDGVDLGELVQRCGRLPIADACNAIRQAAVAVAHIHDQGLIHRDLKPSNLMLTRSGQLKVLDLGLARLWSPEQPDTQSPVSGATGSELTHSGQVLGTLDYMAPEQFRGSRKVDSRADIYSLGATLYTLLVGKTPLQSLTPDSTSNDPMAISGGETMFTHLHRQRVPGPLIEILRRMMAREPSERYATLKPVIDALSSLVVGSNLAAMVCREDDRQSFSHPPPSVPHSPVTTHFNRAITNRAFVKRLLKSRLGVFAVGAPAIALLVWLTFTIVIRFGRVAIEVKVDDPPAVTIAPSVQTQPDRPPLLTQTLQHIEMTVVGSDDESRRGFPNPLPPAFDTAQPIVQIDLAAASAKPLRVSRLVFCREDVVPSGRTTSSGQEIYKPRTVNLWVPVGDRSTGDQFDAATQLVATETSGFGELQPDLALADGVYCLHTDTLSEDAPPTFSVPFVIRGWGEAEVNKSVVRSAGRSVTLLLDVHNSGQGDLNDASVRVTLQKQQGSRANFIDSQEQWPDAIPSSQTDTLTFNWDSGQWKPGVYYFYGYITDRFLRSSTNSQCTFTSDAFEIGVIPSIE